MGDPVSRKSVGLCLLFAVVIVLLILVVRSLSKSEPEAETEHATNPKKVYTSGADLRFQSGLTAANQRPYSSHQYVAPVHQAVVDNDLSPDAATESLSASVSEPDTWATGRDLGQYKQEITGATPGLSPNRGGPHIENMYEGDPRNEVYEFTLQDALYTAT